MGKNQKTVYWILQDNQTTELIIEFLARLGHGVRKFACLKFLIPSHCMDTVKAAKKLDPVVFKVSSAIKHNSLEGFNLKKDLLKGHEFTDGLPFWQALLLDDLGSGNIFRAEIHHEIEPDTRAVILQIPTPLGSSSPEERVFYAWVYLARQAGIKVIGYELLPLNTRWTLAPSLLDSVITTTRASYKHLKSKKAGLKTKIWLAPRHEGRLFSPGCPPLWRNALFAAHGLKKSRVMDFKRTIIYIPHNVAMIHEYKTLVSMLTPFAHKIHLMFSIGKDQVRGTHKHNEIIEIISKKDLGKIPFSFHDINAPWQMAVADCVAACSACYATSIAVNHNIPTLIYDTMVAPGRHNSLESFNNQEKFLDSIKKIIECRNERTGFARILSQTLNKSSSETGDKI